MKYAANIITVCRIPMSFAMISMEPFSAPFFLLYLLCALSDVLDGFVARKFGLSSKAGALLDSAADVIFVFSSIAVFITALHFEKWMYTAVLSVLFIRIISLAVGLLRFHAFAARHTYLNKAAGGLLFCFPFMYLLFGLAPAVIIVWAVSLISGAEELLINYMSSELDRDIKSIFSVADRRLK